MQDCRAYEEALWEVAAGGAHTPELEAHLKGCERCRRAAQAITSAARGLEALRSVEAPDPRVAVWARIAYPKRRPSWVWAWTAAAAACGLLALWFAFGDRERPTSAARPRAAQVARGNSSQAATSRLAAPAVPDAPVNQLAKTEAAPKENVVQVHAGPPVRKRHPAPVPQAVPAVHRSRPEMPAPVQAVTTSGDGTVAPQQAETCSETTGAAYRAIGRGLMVQFLERRNEAG